MSSLWICTLCEEWLQSKAQTEIQMQGLQISIHGNYRYHVYTFKDKFYTWSTFIAGELNGLTLELREGYTLGKDEYGNTIDYQLSVEYSYTVAYHYVEMDVENCTLTIGDLYEDDTPRKESKTSTFDNYGHVK